MAVTTIVLPPLSRGFEPIDGPDLVALVVSLGSMLVAGTLGLDVLASVYRARRRFIRR